MGQVSRGRVGKNCTCTCYDLLIQYSTPPQWPNEVDVRGLAAVT